MGFVTLISQVEIKNILFITIFWFCSNIMKKKLSLIVRHRAARKKHNKITHSPRINSEEEPWTPAKQYLFSLHEHEQNSDNYSRLMQFDSNRKKQDHSISQWDNKQSQGWSHPLVSQNHLDVTVGLKKHNFRFKTEHKEDEMLAAKLGEEINISRRILSPHKLQSKVLRRTGRPQNLSQLEINSPQGQKPNHQQLSTISNKSKCIQTIKLMIRNQKTRIKMNTEVLPVSHFIHDFPYQKIDKATLSPKNQDKLTLSSNKTAQGLQKATRDTLFLSDRLNDAEKRKKFDILFIRHKLRRREGVWGDREKRIKDFFEADGHSWISQTKLK